MQSQNNLHMSAGNEFRQNVKNHWNTQIYFGRSSFRIFAANLGQYCLINSMNRSWERLANGNSYSQQPIINMLGLRAMWMKIQKVSSSLNPHCKRNPITKLTPCVYPESGKQLAIFLRTLEKILMFSQSQKNLVGYVRLTSLSICLNTLFCGISKFSSQTPYQQWSWLAKSSTFHLLLRDQSLFRNSHQSFSPNLFTPIRLQSRYGNCY